MDAVRFYTALILVVGVPAAMSMWFVIHPLARFWRRRGPVPAYLAVVAVAAAIAFELFRWRGVLLAVEFGFRWPLTAAGIVCLAGAVWLERQYRRQIDIRTLFGLPEVSRTRPSQLLTAGIYGRLRHPRYLGLLLELSAFALFVNYLAAYAVVAAAIPLGYLLVRLEERELLQRFGKDYERYLSEVPRFWPRWRLRQR